MSLYTDYDFIGFTYNGKHSIRDLGIYRTSNSNRFEDNLTPTLKEKTASVEGMDGQYYFGTKVEQKVFTIPFAFDGLSEKQVRNLKKVFNGDGIHELIFDEYPYKVYSAKVTGTASMKHLCFEVEGQRKYRGEGSIQFTCYYPYARTRHSNELKTYSGKVLPITYIKTTEDGENYYYELQAEKIKTVSCGIIVSSDYSLSYNRPFYNGESLCETVSISYQVLGEKTIRIFQEPGNVSTSSYIINPKMLAENKKILIHSISYTLVSTKKAFSGNSSPVVSPSYTPTITQDGVTYQYQDCGAFGTMSDLPNGKILNHFNIVDFPNKWQWADASDLPLHGLDNEDHGDVSPPFVLTLTNLPKFVQVEWGNLKVEVETEYNPEEKGEYGTLVWSSKTGLVTNLKGSILPHSGSTVGTVQDGDIVVRARTSEEEDWEEITSWEEEGEIISEEDVSLTGTSGKDGQTSTAMGMEITLYPVTLTYTTKISSQEYTDADTKTVIEGNKEGISLQNGGNHWILQKSTTTRLKESEVKLEGVSYSYTTPSTEVSITKSLEYDYLYY